MTLADLDGLDAESWKDTAYAGEAVPTLEDALALADGRGRLYLDIKAEGAAQAIVTRQVRRAYRLKMSSSERTL